MTPIAFKIPADPTARVPRELFGHAHSPTPNVFPEVIALDETTRIIIKIPDNFNGIDDAYLILLPTLTDATYTLNVTVHSGQDTEIVNIHTQTVNPFNFASVMNVFNYVDLLIPFAVVFALFTAGDTVTMDIILTEDSTLTVYGAVISES